MIFNFTDCSWEIAPSMDSCISSIGVLQRLSTNGETSKLELPGLLRMCSRIAEELLPKTSEKASPN